VNIDVSRQYRADSCLTVVENYTDLIVIKTDGTGGYTGLIWDVSIHRYTVTVNASNIMEFMVGFAPSKLFDASESNFHACGWCLHLRNGTLYSQNGDSGKAYSSECELGDTITCIYNSSTSEISFEKNGVSLGVAYTNVNGEDIAPAVVVFSSGNIITLCIV
jgi:SPRY domain